MTSQMTNLINRMLNILFNRGRSQLKLDIVIISIQFLRFLAAFFVLLFHTLGEYEWAKPFGSFGVDIFFVISGFIIYVITDKGIDHFFKKRIIRIVPLYWLFTFGIALIALLQPNLLNSASWDIKHITASIFFVPYWTEGSGFFPILKLGWTLNFEMLFYLIFYLSSRITIKYRALLTSINMIGMMLFLNLIDFYSEYSFLSFYSDTIWFEFIFGMMVGVFYNNRNFLNLNFKYSIFVVLAPLIWMASNQIFSYSTYPPFLVFGLPSCFLLIAFLGYERIFLRANNPLRKLILWLGEMSYPLYLVHTYCIALIRRVLFKDLEFGLLFTITVFISLFISDALSRVYDKPLRKWLISNYVTHDKDN